MPNAVSRQRAKTAALRSRLIYHRKQGRPAPKLVKAYQRAKAELALLIRKARRNKIKHVTRAQWGAAPPRGDYTEQGHIYSIAVHHTASSQHLFGKGVSAEAAHVREIQRWHFARDFNDIGYALIIGPSGTVFEGRPESAVGAHVGGHNTGSIGISLIGNFEQEEPTDAQMAALAREIRRLRLKHGSFVKVRGHRDYSGHESNACPGRNLYRQLPR